MGIGPLIAHEGQKKQMAGDLALVTQKSSGHRTRAPLDRFDLACGGSYQKTQEAQRSWPELLLRVLSRHIPTVLTFFFT